MDYLTLRIPADTKEKITSTTWTGEPPWQGSNGMYEQCGCDMIQVVPAAYEDVRRKHHLKGELFCDEEALCKAAPRAQLACFTASLLVHESKQRPAH